MPDFPAIGDVPRIVSQSYTIDFLAVGGDHGFTSIDKVPTNITGLQLAALRTALGNMSNARVVGDTASTMTNVNLAAPEVAPYDEAYASVGTRASLVFQNDDLETRSVSIPAPDASIFESDGVTVNPTNALVIAAVGAILTVINGDLLATDTYAYLRGFRQEISRKLPKGRSAKAAIEPLAGINPPDAPGV